MDPAGNCPYCGSTYSGDKCSNCSLKEKMSSLIDCNTDSIPFLDKIEEESKAYDESADKSAKTGTDSTASAFEDPSQIFLEEGGDQYDSSPLSSVTKDVLLSEINPPTPVNEESCMEDLLEENCASIQRLEIASEFLSSPQADVSTCSSKYSPTFSQAGSPLYALPFEPLVSEDSNAWEEEMDKDVKSTDSSQKKDAKVDKNKQNICGTPSKDDRGSLSTSSFPESTKNQNEFEGLPSCSHADPSRSDSRGHSRSKSKKSPLKHSERKSFPCTKCGKILITKQGFADHMFLHTKEKPISCEHCKAVFAHKKYLKVHRRRHTGEHPYLCEMCGRSFPYRSGFVVHIRTHTGEKPYTCKACDESFTHRNTYIRHTRRHTK